MLFWPIIILFLQLHIDVVDMFDSSGFKCNDLEGQLVSLSDYSAARCIDGSPPAYYFRPGKDEGLSKWIIFFEGGGWCHSYESCLNRTLTPLGSSLHYPPCLKMRFMVSADRNKNPMM